LVNYFVSLYELLFLPWLSNFNYICLLEEEKRLQILAASLTSFILKMFMSSILDLIALEHSELGKFSVELKMGYIISRLNAVCAADRPEIASGFLSEVCCT
jgi:hypothetical protein